MEPEYFPEESLRRPSNDKRRYLLLALGCLVIVVVVLLAAVLLRPGARFPIAMNGRFGYIDRSGKLVIPAQFGDAGHFDEGLGPVQVGKMWGYADHKGKLAIPPQFD